MNLVLPFTFKHRGLSTRHPLSRTRLAPTPTFAPTLPCSYSYYNPSTKGSLRHYTTNTNTNTNTTNTNINTNTNTNTTIPQTQPQQATLPETQPDVPPQTAPPEQTAQPEVQVQSQPQPEGQVAQPEVQQAQPGVQTQTVQPETQPTQPVEPQPSQLEQQAKPAAVPYFTQLSKRSRHISYLRPETKISNLEEEISYPVRIVGTRKSSKRMFWTWDSFYSIFLKSKGQPKFYLTFEDSNGKVIGPVMYNTKLTGRGFQLGLGWRFLLGNISGEIENTYFNQIPRQLSVTGSDFSFYTFSAFCGFSFTRLAFDEIPGIKVSYFGPTLFGALGYVSIKNGYLEAEPHIKSIGLPSFLEYLGKIIVALVFLIGIFLTIVPILYPLGVLDPLIERLARL